MLPRKPGAFFATFGGGRSLESPVMYRIASALLPALLGLPMASAAPMTSVDGAETAPTKAADVVAPAGGASGPAGLVGIPQSRTVELLLQMQDQAAQKPAGESTAVPRTVPARGSVAADAAAGPDETPLNSLKSAILNSPVGRSGDAQESPVQAQRAGLRMDAPGIAPSGSPKAGGESSSSLLNQPVIRFIRENRGLTMLGCAVVLAVVWATATFSSSRRSRSRPR